jgi:hypothetical protein
MPVLTRWSNPLYYGDQWHKHKLGLSLNQTLISDHCKM